MDIKDLLNLYYVDGEYRFGIDTVMEYLCPNCLYTISTQNGNFDIVEWNDNNEVGKPSSQQIRDEYIRQQTIKEILDKYNIEEK